MRRFTSAASTSGGAWRVAKEDEKGIEFDEITPQPRPPQQAVVFHKVKVQEQLPPKTRCLYYGPLKQHSATPRPRQVEPSKAYVQHKFGVLGSMVPKTDECYLSFQHHELLPALVKRVRAAHAAHRERFAHGRTDSICRLPGKTS